MSDMNKLYEAILGGNLAQAVETTKTAIAENIAPEEVINQYMIKAMEEIGRRFEEGKAFVPELLMAARAMKGSLELLRPLMEGNKSATLGKVVIGTVKGDLHDIGKNLVASMLEGCGFEVVNLGIDITGEKFVDACKTENADIICLSSLLTTTMPYMSTVIESLQSAGIRNKVKIMIGGAPVTREYADQIGADGYSNNASGAVNEAKRLMGIA